MLGPRTTRLPYVEASKARGKLYLYYRRDGKRVALPGPEGSAAFLSEYDRVHREFERPSVTSSWGRHTVGTAITEYLASADYQLLSDASKRHYALYLNEVRDRAGRVALVDVDAAWVTGLRNRLAHDHNRWNRTRSLMRRVFDDYGATHPGVIATNPWAAAKRFKCEGWSDQNRMWPDEVLVAVLRAATPEFRALVVTLLLTSQRLSDVVAFRPSQYDPDTRTLGFTDRFAQQKTKTPLVLSVPEALAEVFDAVHGRHDRTLLVTPRGVPWTAVNAQETMLRIRAILGLDRYTLHGLRATGPSKLAQGGVALAVIMALTGHQSERTLRDYLRGVDRSPLAKVAQETLAAEVAPTLGRGEATPGSSPG